MDLPDRWWLPGNARCGTALHQGLARQALSMRIRRYFTAGLVVRIERYSPVGMDRQSPRVHDLVRSCRYSFISDTRSSADRLPERVNLFGGWIPQILCVAPSLR